MVFSYGSRPFCKNNSFTVVTVLLANVQNVKGYKYASYLVCFLLQRYFPGDLFLIKCSPLPPMGAFISIPGISRTFVFLLPPPELLYYSAAAAADFTKLPF